MNTQDFPGLRPYLAPMGSRVRTTLRALRQDTLSGIEEHLAPALGSTLLDKPSGKDHSRRRTFTLTRTFWCWIWQVLQGATSCREAVRQVQILFAVHGKGRTAGKDTGAFCRARRKIAGTLLDRLLAASHRSAEAVSSRDALLQGRPLRIVDGSSVRVPDTAANRRAFPGARNQFAKPGFPMLTVLVLFSAASGAILARVVGNFLQSELRLFLELAEALRPGDILAADRHFGNFLTAALARRLAVDLVARVSTRNRKVDFRQAHLRLGRNDAVFLWRKPRKASPLLSAREWKALPDAQPVRVIRFQLSAKGSRTTDIVLMTTLLDPVRYPAAEILAAYGKRWRLEMCLDDLKTTLGMEMLGCRSPDMLRKELAVFLIAHNLMRWVMGQAARAGKADLERISFKGTLDGFRQVSAGASQIRGTGRTRRVTALWQRFLEILASDPVPSRPGRQEPRAVKKRSKYPVLNKPRRAFKERWSRNKRRRVARAKRAVA
jgi:Transposase DDE domain